MGLYQGQPSLSRTQRQIWYVSQYIISGSMEELIYAKHLHLQSISFDVKSFVIQHIQWK